MGGWLAGGVAASTWQLAAGGATGELPSMTYFLATALCPPAAPPGAVRDGGAAPAGAGSSDRRSSGRIHGCAAHAPPLWLGRQHAPHTPASAAAAPATAAAAAAAAMMGVGSFHRQAPPSGGWRCALRQAARAEQSRCGCAAGRCTAVPRPAPSCSAWLAVAGRPAFRVRGEGAQSPLDTAVGACVCAVHAQHIRRVSIP